jgi:DNA-binding transcriptional ArsR family regulator
MSLPAVMKHLKVLEKAGLVTQRKSGRTRRCQLVARPLKKAEAWISQYRAFWDAQFAALDRYLAQRPAEVAEWPKNNYPQKPR